MTARSKDLRGRLGAAMLLGSALAFPGAEAARAQSCQEDFQKLSEKRMAHIAELNKISKATKGKLDPIATCPVARKLVASENEMVAYLQKNKEWCNIPDAALENFTQQRGRDQNLATQACAYAAKAKKMQEEAAAGGGPQAQKLPAGPL